MNASIKSVQTADAGGRSAFPAGMSAMLRVAVVVVIEAAAVAGEGEDTPLKPLT
jgi:hypothetical protein